jgi:hypothetical protein
MDPGGNAVVASQATLGEMMGVHRNTVRKAIAVLEKERWIEVVEIGGKGGALAYVVNSRVAWGRDRNAISYARFTASVLASSAEQTQPLDDRPALRQVPVLLRGERQLPSGAGANPPSQPAFDGLEPDLPALRGEEQLDLLTGEIINNSCDAS